MSNTNFVGKTVTIKEELFQLLEAVYGQLWDERESWAGEEGENTEDLTAIYQPCDAFIQKEIYGDDSFR